MNKGSLRILVTYSAATVQTQTTRDFLESFAEHFPGDVHYLHVTHGASILIDLNQYDVIINNYCVRHCFHNYASDDYVKKLTDYKGLKVVIAQDEYDNTDLFIARVMEIGFDVLLTCVPQDSLEYVYPRDKVGSLRMETILTGYVPDVAVSETRRPLAERPVVIGYRGRDIGGRYGRLGFDKYEIGRRMEAICRERDIPCDIRMDEESRIYGAAWREFLASCRVTLGSESGSNVFDFNGSLRRRFEELQSRLGRLPRYDDFLAEIGDREADIEMGQVSPRIFEYAAAYTPMVLFRGRYSDAVRPDEHYIVLEKDFSNIDDVLRRIDDIPGLEAMADRAYMQLIGSGQYSYRTFIARVSRVISDELPRVVKRRPDRLVNTEELSHRRRHSLVLESPTKRPISYETFELQYGLLAYEAEVNRMVMIEQQVLDGFEAAAEMIYSRSGSVVDKASNAAADNLAKCLVDCRNAFARLRRERVSMQAEVFSGNVPPSDSAVAGARALYERQMNEMYGLYTAIDSAYEAALTQFSAAESVAFSDSMA